MMTRNWDCAVCGGKITFVATVGGFPALEMPISELLASHMFDNRRAEVVAMEIRAAKEKGSATKGRERVKWAIVHQICQTGTFNGGDLEQFWSKFDDALCDKCKERISKGANLRKRVKELLEEAIKLDPTNDPAKRNLGALS